MNTQPVELCWQPVTSKTDYPLPTHEDDIILLDCTAYAGCHCFERYVAMGNTWFAYEDDATPFEDSWDVASSYLLIRWTPPSAWIKGWNVRNSK